MSAARMNRVMAGTVSLTATQFRLVFRDWTAVFWTLLFPVVMVIVFGEAYGNEPRPEFGGLGFVDQFVPGLMAVAISSSALYQAGTALVDLRERQVLRRLRLLPLAPWSLLLSQMIPSYLLILLTSAAIWLTARFGYGARTEGSLLLILAAITFGSISFLALALTMAGLLRTSSSANALSGGLNMIMMVFSGAIVPLDLMSDKFQTIGKLIPLTYVVNLLRDAFQGASSGGTATAVLVLAGCLVGGALVGNLTFRWE